jgi:polygalacturonase
MTFSRRLGLLGGMLLAAPLAAQDRRAVGEPRFPSACTALEARLDAPGGLLSEESERRPDTERLQEAIDRCPAGQAVKLTRAGEKYVFLSGPLRLKPGVTLWVDAHAAVFGSRNPRDYDVEPGSCGILTPTDARGRGCRPLILAEDAPGSGVMGDGAIDGRGGAVLLAQDLTWWELAKKAKVLDLQQSCPRVLVVRRSNDFTLYRITIRNSPNFHVVAEQTDGFTAWGVKIKTPKTARNSDGIDPSSSTNVTIAHCHVDTGDDDVAIKAGNAGPATHMTIAHNHFYSGHGMSIGSNTNGGARAIRVVDLTIDGADNGLRIKSDRSRGGLVEDVSYEDVCLRNVANPIVLTTMYTTFPGERLPVYRDIRLKDVRGVTNGRSTVRGLDAAHPVEVSLDNVTIDGLRPEDVTAAHAVVRIGPRRGNFVPSGEGVTVRDEGAGPAVPSSCAGRFEPFPDLPTAPAAAVRVPPEDPTLYVAADGTGDYWSIQRAIDVAPAAGAVISVAPGTYRERLRITRPGMRIRSPYEDASRTVVVFDASAGTAGSTLKSATVEVQASDFLAENLTFANDWNATHPQLPQGSQAVALKVIGDRAVFRNVRVLGNQDTLYVGSTDCEGPNGRPCTPARAYFERCHVEGNVDFVFGDGKAFFEDCTIHSTPHEDGFVTAQGKHYLEQDSAFVFHRCRLTAEPGVAGVWLGRPWRDFATVVFLDTEMGGHVEPAGWREWHPGATNRLETAYFAERGSSGPGARPEGRSPRAKALTGGEADLFARGPFLAGADSWDPLSRLRPGPGDRALE